MAGNYKGKSGIGKAGVAAALTLISVFVVPAFAAGNDGSSIEQRIIKIEGSVDKPRVLFIVPRAKLVKQNAGKSGFTRELAEPAYPATPGAAGGRTINDDKTSD